MNKQPSAEECCNSCKRTKGSGPDDLDCNGEQQHMHCRIIAQQPAGPGVAALVKLQSLTIGLP